MKKLLIGLFIFGGVIIISTFGSHATLSPTYTEVKFPTTTLMSWKSSFPVQCNQIIFSYSVMCQRADGYTVNVADRSNSVITDYSYFKNKKYGYIITTQPHYKKTTTIINGSTVIY